MIYLIKYIYIYIYIYIHLLAVTYTVLFPDVIAAYEYDYGRP